MFSQFRKLNNESGVVLFIVLITAIIIMVFSLGILTQSLNETNYAQQQVDQITSDELAKGVFWNAYSDSLGQGNKTYTFVMPTGRTYSVNTVIHGTTVNVTSNYDTFQ
ncbi:MAG: hypothetical protein KGJ09_04940 [Candidatus Omnitrophica bacterium]|nr:hypothetical protein [Candidatus Omnitrophota bacterium]MDE2009409.1 hypothetical protein [Candidatus Omnitrophota bacterium]MDE2214193.1 hypothetical protein [Candidatus Omnitrophota bacterium]MDE2231230.1 hypothetical protein [Candidatus Omnitrophota bacterium]